jgi:hypothetical protein
MKRTKTLQVLGIGAGLLACVLAGCATQSGGQTDPILSKLVPGTLADNPTILAMYATQACNAAAAKEYNLNMVICGNPTAFVAQLPGNPFVTPAQIATAIGAACTVNGYTTNLPATVTVGNCPIVQPASSIPSMRMGSGPCVRP